MYHEYIYTAPDPPDATTVSVNAPGISPVQTMSVAEVIVPATIAAAVTDSLAVLKHPSSSVPVTVIAEAPAAFITEVAGLATLPKPQE